MTNRAARLPMRALARLGFTCLLGFLVAAGTGRVADGLEAAANPKPVDVVFVIDNSASMKVNDPEHITGEVVMDFFQALSKDSHVGMVVFDHGARLVHPLTRVGARSEETFSESLEQVDYEGQWTDSPAGIERALYEFKTHGRADSRKIIVFLSDGIIDSGDSVRDTEASRWLREDLALQSRSADIQIFGIAFTETADVRLIQALATKTRAEYFRAYRAEDIPDVLSSILTFVAEPETPLLQAREPVPSVVAGAPPLAGSANSTADTPTATTPAESGDRDSGLPFYVILALAIAAALVAIAAGVMVLRQRNETPTKASAPEGLTTKLRDLIAIRPRKPLAKLVDLMRASSARDGVISLSLKSNRLKVGREGNNDVPIRKGTISSFHATIDYRDGYYYVEDQRSTNGTFLNRRKLEPHQPAQLKSGDRIQFAAFDFEFIVSNHVPAGKTVVLPPSTMTPEPRHSQEEGSSSEPGSAPAPLSEAALFHDCLEHHLQKIDALGHDYEKFIQTRFTASLKRSMSSTAHDLMRQAEVDGKGRHTSFAYDAIQFVLCVVPFGTERATAWFGEQFGGFLELLSHFLASDSFARDECSALCVITYGRDANAWTSITIAPGDHYSDPVDLMSVELLTNEERRVLDLRFSELGQVL